LFSPVVELFLEIRTSRKLFRVCKHASNAPEGPVLYFLICRQEKIEYVTKIYPNDPLSYQNFGGLQIC